MEPLPYFSTVVPRRPSHWYGGHEAGLLKIGAVLVGIGLLLPADLSDNVSSPFPIWLTWLVLLLAFVYILDRLLSVPGRTPNRVLPLWVLAAAAVGFVYLQIWFLKDQKAMKRGMWRFEMLWPVFAAFVTVVAFGILSRVRPPAAG